MKLTSCFNYVVVLVFLCLGWSQLSYSSESYANKLEHAIYTEEVVGDLNAASELYKNIIENKKTNSFYVAESIFRLAQCQEKLGDTQSALLNYKKIIELYPNLSKLKHMASKALTKGYLQSGDLLPVPWGEGELLTYTGYSQDKVSYHQREVKSKLIDRDAWGTKINVITPYNEGRNFTENIIDTKTASEIYSFSRGVHNKGLSRKVLPTKVTFNNLDKNTEYSIKKRTSQYWMEASSMRDLLRRLPLSNRYAVKLSLMQDLIADFLVVGSEEVTVLSGSFHTFKVAITITLNGDVTDKIFAWVSKGEFRHVVKFESHNHFLELTTFGPQVKGEILYEIKGADLEIMLPDGWSAYKKVGERDKTYRTLLSPYLSFETTSYYFKDKKEYYDWDNLKMEDAVAEIETWDYSYLNYYSRNKESDHHFLINGHPAASFTSDIRYNTEEWVDYHIIVANEPFVEHFIFQTEKSEFESRKSVYDDIINSIVFK